MPRICILTDSTAQFTRPDFPGHEHVFVIPMGVSPASPEADRLQAALLPPSVQDFTRFFTHLSKEFDAILVLMVSSHLNPALLHAEKARQKFINHASIETIDSQTTAAGLGMLVEVAAEASNNGATLAEVEQRVRTAIKRIYVLICIPELTHLVGLGLLNQTQAVVGEMLGMQPIFVIEEGVLVSMEKVRTPRHLFECFQEFMSEFTAPKQIALLRGSGQNTVRTRPLRQFVEETFPGTTYSEHGLNQHLTVLFGTQSTGLIVMDPV
jgi:DegV family protein with EDD domain